MRAPRTDGRNNRTRSRADSREVSGACGDDGGLAISVESDRMPLSCSNVAKLATEALAALDAGQIDLARERLAALVSATAP